MIIRWSQQNVAIDPSYFTFSRFLLGFLIVAGIILVKRHPLRVYNPHVLIGRAVTNCLAVYFFYMAVKYHIGGRANILNMTYPLFIALGTWLFLKNQRDPVTTATVLVACVGVWMVLAPDGGIVLRQENLWGLMSGLSAAASMIYLNLSRKEHDTTTVLFFVFGIGSLMMLLFFFDRFFIPDRGAYLSCHLLYSRYRRPISVNRWISLCHGRGRRHYLFIPHFIGRNLWPFFGHGPGLEYLRLDGRPADFWCQCDFSAPQGCVGPCQKRLFSDLRLSDRDFPFQMHFDFIDTYFPSMKNPCGQGCLGLGFCKDFIEMGEHYLHRKRRSPESRPPLLLR